jgi:hypothetical protein
MDQLVAADSLGHVHVILCHDGSRDDAGLKRQLGGPVTGQSNEARHCRVDLSPNMCGTGDGKEDADWQVVMRSAIARLGTWEKRCTL